MVYILRKPNRGVVCGWVAALSLSFSSSAKAFNVDFDLGLAERENLSRPAYWPETEQEISVAARLRPLDLLPIWVTAAHVLHSARGVSEPHHLAFSSLSGSSFRMGARGEWAFHPRATLFGEGGMTGQGVLHLEGIQGRSGERDDSGNPNGIARFKGVIFGFGLGWEMTPFFMTSIAWHRSEDKVHMTAEEGGDDQDFALSAQRVSIAAGVRW